MRSPQVCWTRADEAWGGLVLLGGKAGPILRIPNTFGHFAWYKLAG